MSSLVFSASFEYLILEHFFNAFSVAIDFRLQNLMSKDDPRAERVSV